MVFKALTVTGAAGYYTGLGDDLIENLNTHFKETAKSLWHNNGYWKESPYLALSESFLNQEEKVILFQHIIVDTEENIEIYRFWTHFFSQNDVGKMLEAHNFIDINFREDILPEGDLWNGDNVIFTMTSK